MSEKMSRLSSPQAELSLLSSALRANAEQRVQMVSVVQEEWFTSAERAQTWRVMHEMIAKSLPVDATLLCDGLKAHLSPEIAERLTAELAQGMPTAHLWQPLAERVEGYFVRRRGVEACMSAQRQFMDLSVSPHDALEGAESDLFALHSTRGGKGMRHVSESLNEAYLSIEESISNRGYVIGGLPTGFTGIDQCYIKGMRKGHVIMLVAPPGGGKTVAMMKLAWNRASGSGDYAEHAKALELAADHGRHLNYQACRVGVFTLEMDDVQLTERLLITLSRVEMMKMQRGQMSARDQDNMRSAHKKIMESQLYFDFVPGISIQELRVKARYAVMRFKLSMICIDYAQLITSSSKAAQGNRTQEMVDVSKGLKLLAQECGVPVIVLAQPKQETWGQRAGLNAMAETAQLAKDADLVIMFGVWDVIAKQMKTFSRADKKAVAGDDSDDDDELPREPDDPCVTAYADIVKNRHGPNTNGKPPIKLMWERDFFDFKSTNDRLFDPSGNYR